MGHTDPYGPYRLSYEVRTLKVVDFVDFVDFD